MLGPPAWAMNKLGAKNSYLERHKGEVYRFFVPIFLHAGFIRIYQLNFDLFPLFNSYRYYIQFVGAAEVCMYFYLSLLKILQILFDFRARVGNKNNNVHLFCFWNWRYVPLI